MYSCIQLFCHTYMWASSIYIPPQCTVASSFYIPRQCTVASSFNIPHQCTVASSFYISPQCTVESSFYIPPQSTVASNYYIPRQCTVASQKTYTSRGTGDFCRTPVTGTAADARFSRHLSFILVRLVLWVSMNNCEFFLLLLMIMGIARVPPLSFLCY